MPANGVLALGELDAAQWIFAEVDLAKVAELRADGGVLNARHWAEQPGGDLLPAVEVVDLT
jgi:predicted amidohydrolase